MSKSIKYSDLSKRIGKKIHIPVKNIDTVILENYDNYDRLYIVIYTLEVLIWHRI